MFRRRIQAVFNIKELIAGNCSGRFIIKNGLHGVGASYSTISGSVELPRKLKRSERKPLVTGVNELKRRARAEKKERREAREVHLKPPENGLLVKGLVPVAHEVLAAKAELFVCVSRVAEEIPVYSCR